MARGRKNRRRVDREALRAATFNAVLRALKATFLIALLVGMCLVAAYGAGKVKEYFCSSPTFAIEKFRFEGINHAQQHELIRLGGVAVGDNIFRIDLPEIEKGMSDHPWVQHVVLERKYPRTVVIRVKEYEPAALAELGGFYYVDSEGKAFKKLALGEPADFPVLRGFTREDYVAGKEEIEKFFREALKAFNLYSHAGLEKQEPVSEIQIDRHDGFNFFCGHQAMVVRLGFGQFKEKFLKLEKILASLSSRNQKAEIIYLDNRTRPTWVPVQLANQEEEKVQ